jgi:hypothetical protein
LLNDRMPHVRLMLESDNMAALLSQARSARIYHDARADKPAFFQELMNNPMPHLRSFVFTSKSEDTYLLSSRFMNGHTKSLTKLVLCNVCVQIEKGLHLSSLTHLHLNVSHTTDMIELFAFIQSAHRLERLVLLSRSNRQLKEDLKPLDLPHLQLLHLNDDILVISHFLHLFPYPRLTYQLSVVRSEAQATDRLIEQSMNMRIQVVEQAAQFLGLEQNPDLNLSVCLSQKSFRRRAGLRCQLSAEHPDGTISTFRYDDLLLSLNNLNRVVDSAQTLYVRGPNMMRTMLDYVTGNPSQPLLAVNRLIIESNIIRDLKDLLDWLRMRASSGRRIRVIDFRDPWLYVKYDSIAEFSSKFQLIEQGLVDTVLDEGHELS